MADSFDVLLDIGGSTEPDPGFRRDVMARVLAALDERTEPAQHVSLPLIGTERGGDVHAVELDEDGPGDRDGGHRMRRLLLVAALIAAVGLGFLVQFARRDAADNTPAVTVTSPPPTTSPPSSTPTTVADRDCPNPEGGFSNHCLGALDPGTYRTTTFEPSFTFTVPAGWSNIQDTAGNYVLLPPDESLSGFGSGTSDYIGVYASVAAPAGCDEYPDTSVATTAQAYVEWLRAQPSLVVGVPTPVVVGGLDGTQIDVRPSDQPACSSPGVQHDYRPILIGTNASLLGYEAGHRGDRVDANTRYRLIVFDRPDGTLMVIELADTGNDDGTDSWWTTAADVTNTFEFEP